MATKSARYGKGFEYEVRDLLREATDIDSFERVPHSGAWVGGKNAHRANTAREDMVDMLSGDIVTPEGWRWVVECKNHEDVPIHQLFFGDECKAIDEFLGQICDDADTTGKEPLLIFKIRKKPYSFKKKFKDQLKEAKIAVPKINSVTTGIMVAEIMENCDEMSNINHIQYTRKLEDGEFQTWRFFDFTAWLELVKVRQFPTIK